MNEYERLTKRENGLLISTNEIINKTLEERYDIMKHRLCELEDKIENGTFVELPCKIGDILYQIFQDYKNDYAIYIGKVREIRIIPNDILIDTMCGTLFYKEYSFKDFNKTVFLTKELAEARLKELKRGKK